MKVEVQDRMFNIMFIPVIVTMIHFFTLLIIVIITIMVLALVLGINMR